ncbi:sigma-70 family RNA polymerase sigma factor [Porticoccus sp. W117]|uniref:RNA polymerase sigma factor n=1 Tax=Porticoccus sp. W117 TaxID=3054777 RepID=UPI0025926A40|nr:sigma-70 family RNA polymerase sigma factor [Porticoccus sp. W117]MDM3870857.1 sigma-70 family RNA polymerase sigma factor [Porticoccus sp. W117]
MKYSNKRRIERLIKKHGPTLVNFLSKRLKNREDAEDIAQSTFLRLYTMDNPERVDNPRAFLFQVAANMSVDQLRRQARMNNYLDKEHAKVESEPSASSDSPDQLLEAQQKSADIYHVIESMPSNVRQAFMLSRTRNLPYGEIAKLMGVSVSSVEKYILEALKQCRQALLTDKIGGPE